jgi:hypothetical protein
MNEAIKNLRVSIVRFVDDSFPGWVECDFKDAYDKKHTIVDKVPMVTTEMLDSTSPYPAIGSVPCQVREECHDAQGRDLVRIATVPIESTEGIWEFTVLSEQLLE